MTTEPLSNSLTDLADHVGTVYGEFETASRTAYGKALVAGALLIGARGACEHGRWLPFLKRAGVPERQAQRLMSLANAGLNSDTVSDLGGIRAALAMVGKARLPDVEELLVVYYDPDEPGSAAVVHRDLKQPEYLFVDGYDVQGDHYAAVVTSRRPMNPALVKGPDGTFRSVIWAAIHNIMGAQLAGSEAVVVPRQGWTGWVAEFNDYRAKAAA